MQQCKIPRDCATTTLKRGCGRQRWARRHRALTAALFLTFLRRSISVGLTGVRCTVLIMYSHSLTSDGAYRILGSFD